MRQNKSHLISTTLFILAAVLSIGTTSVHAAMNAPASVPLIPFRDTWPVAAPRWWDISNDSQRQFDAFLGLDGTQQFNYSGIYTDPQRVTQARLTYDTAPDGSYFVGHIEATGLKPNFAYQMKLVGKQENGPGGWGSSGDDLSNKRIGLIGRWFCGSHGASTNFQDPHYVNYYENQPDNLKHDMYGYLFMGDFVTDKYGNASMSFIGQNNYHITRASWEYPGGVPAELVEDPHSPFTIQGGLIQSNPTVYYGYGSTAPSTTVSLYYEYEDQKSGQAVPRPRQVVLPTGTYRCRFVLTEESFHESGNGGFWQTVLGTEDYVYDANGNRIGPDINLDNDVVFTIGAPQLTINDQSISEGNGGTKNLTFTVALSVASSETVKVNYATANGSATTGSDYAAKSGSLTFTPGTMSQDIVVEITGDTVAEGDEIFFVNLSAPVHAALSDAQGIGRILNDDAGPLNVSMAPSNSSRVVGVSNTYTAKYSDLNGAGDIAEARILINSTLNGANALHGLYFAATHKLYLRDNVNGAWLGGFAPGSNNVISNSQGSLNCATTSISGAGNTLTVNWSFTPATTFMGGKYIYMQVRDKSNLVDGWDQMGTVQIVANKAPVNYSLLPGSGSSATGVARTVAAKYFDENGATDIAEARLLVNGSATGVNGLLGMYFAATHKLYLRDNINGSWLGGFAPGSANVISNSQGSLNCAATSVTFGAQILTINWSFTPAANFTGTKNLYLLARDRSNAVDGLEPFGTWTITGGTLSTASSRSASPVTVSSASANAATRRVTLQFTGSLDAATAEDSARYAVALNGRRVAVERAAYTSRAATVTLDLPGGALRAGDTIVVSWQNLRDGQGRSVSGQASLTAR